MPRLPVGGAAPACQAANAYDAWSCVNSHVIYADSLAYNTGAKLDLMIDRLQELGVRHLREGGWSPAIHSSGSAWAQTVALHQKLKARNAARAGGVQPVGAIWGTTSEPQRLWRDTRVAFGDAYNYTVGGRRIFTGAPAGGEFLRPLDGPSGSGYTQIGWDTIDGLQGPNEPDNRGPDPAGNVMYPAEIRATLRALKDAKNTAARANLTACTGYEYIDQDTGRITPGPAKVPQIPVIGFHLVFGNAGPLGDYSDGADVDVGGPHLYWGGHEPNWSELLGANQRGRWDSFNGDLRPAGTPARSLRYFMGEAGYITSAAADGAPGQQRHCPAHIAGEYQNRHNVYCLLAGINRSYDYQLNDEYNDPEEQEWNFGLCTPAWGRKASFYQRKNMLALVGWSQGPAGETLWQPTITGWSAGPNNVHADGYQSPDDLRPMSLRRADGYLVPLVRQRSIWDRGAQTPKAVADPKLLTVTVPPGCTAAFVAIPALNPVQSPTDGQDYRWSGDPTATNGTALRPLTITDGKVQVRVAGLMPVLKFLTSTDTTAPPAPSSCAAVPSGAEAIQVTWGASAAGDLAGYELYARRQGEAWPSTPQYRGTARSYLHVALTAGQTYEYRARAFDGVPNYSTYTATAQATATAPADNTPPPVPGKPVLQLLAGPSILVTWPGVSASDLAGYEVFKRIPGRDQLGQRTLNHLQGFVDWLDGADATIGEVGVPGNVGAYAEPAAGDYAKWAALLDEYLTRLDQLGIGWQYWAGFPNPNYELAPYVGSNIGFPFTTKRAQAATLEAHLEDAGQAAIAVPGLAFGTEGQTPKYSNTNPGVLHSTYYVHPQATFDYLAAQGWQRVKIEFAHERIQTTLGGALNTGYLDVLKGQIQDAADAGLESVIDLHSFHEYETATATLKCGSAGYTRAHFVELWRLLSVEFKDNPNVVGYVLQNEPNGNPGGRLQIQADMQAVVTMLRGRGDTTRLQIPLDNWSKVIGVQATHPDGPWIVDTANNHEYDGHHYPDTELSLGGKENSVFGASYTYAQAVADSASSARFDQLARTALDEIVLPGATYLYKVRSKDAVPNRSAFSLETQITVPAEPDPETEPDAPADLIVQLGDAEGRTVLVSWRAPTNTEIAGYHVFVRKLPAAFPPAATYTIDDPDADGWQITGLLPGATYAITARAFTAAGTIGDLAGEQQVDIPDVVLNKGAVTELTVRGPTTEVELPDSTNELDLAGSAVTETELSDSDTTIDVADGTNAIDVGDSETEVG